MTDRYTDIRAALEAATPGPWSAGVSTVQGIQYLAVAQAGNESVVIALLGFAGAGDENQSISNARYVGACHPEVIRALLAERDALIHDNSEYVSAANELATENQRLREELTEMVDVAERVDGWASFPQAAMDRARAALAQQEQR